jgi:signal peptidase II
MTEGDLSETSEPEITPAPADRTARPASQLRLTAAVAVLVLLLDQLTKRWALSHLDDLSPQHVIWTLQWNLSFNSGMAFSKGQGIGPIIGLAALIVVAVIAVSVRRIDSKSVAVAAGLVMGGALGNLADRVFRGDGWLDGAVIDFIDFQWFPIFNVADMAVNVGGAVFVLWSLFGARKAASP